MPASAPARGAARTAIRTGTRTGVKVVGTVVLLIVAGNVAILAAHWWARQTTPTHEIVSVRGVDNLEAVDDRLWRGAAPSDEGYRGLAAAGVRTVVDLRAEPSAATDEATVTALGMRFVHLPVRDGQVPSGEQVDEFLGVMAETEGVVFVHCGAGVGRTGTMAGAWLVTGGELNGRGAVRRNLAVGPPSLEQVVFVAALSDDGIRRPAPLVTAVSRALDAPRRIWHVIGL
jgi:protein-tyrosine phosphatase